MSNSGSASSPTIVLSTFSTCELSDALIKLGIPHGGHIPDIHAINESSAQTRLCGPAYTVKMVWSGAKDTKLLLENGKHWVDTIPDGSVVVVAAPANAKNAVWGGLMTAGALARGARGAIISGRVRDLDEHASPPQPRSFPIFSRGHSTLGQAPFTRPAALGVPLSIEPVFEASRLGGLETGREEGGENAFPAVVVEPGDYIVADTDGVVCVPRGIWEQVAERAGEGRAVDARCLESIRNGEGVGTAFMKHRGK